MKPLRSGYSQWFGALFIAVGGLSITESQIATAAPPDSPAVVAQAKGAVRPKAVARPRGGRKSSGPVTARAVPLPPASDPKGRIADIYPGSEPAADDLELTRDAEKKAEAMATFARALLDEDSAESDRALKGYIKTLALDPTYTKLAVQVAYEMAKRGDVSGGIQVLKDSVKASPKEPMPLIYLSQLYSKHLKKPDLALKYAEQALTVAPEDFQAYHTLFELHVASGQPKKAEELLARAAKSKSTDPKFWVQLGDLYTRLFLREDGSAAPDHVEEMNAIYRMAASHGKEDASTLAKVGDYFVLSRQVRDAIPYYLQALSKRTSQEDPGVANLREKLARAFLIAEQKDEAIAMLEAVVREQPMRAETYELLGELYEQSGDVEKAMLNYEQTLLIDGSRPDNYLRLAELFMRLKRPDRAVETMRTARGKFPDVPQVTVSLAMTLSQAKKHTEAMTAFAEARAEAEQGHEEMLNASFFFRYGAAAEQAGLLEQAGELLRESIRLDPANAAEAYNYLGYMWVDNGMRLEEAAEMIRKALDLQPNNGAFLDSLGWYHFRKGDYETALRELQRAMENLTEEDPVIFDHLGDTYDKLGRGADALASWQKSHALEANPKVQEKIDAAKRRVTKSEADTQPPGDQK